MVHSVLVNKSKSSSEKSTGLSRELCRLGDRQESTAKKVRSGSEEVDEDASAGAEESRCSGKDGSGAAGPASLSCIRPGISAEF